MKYIHIAGTNGKGSTSEYISSIIMASGASCGCFTSPHLFSATERYMYNGSFIEKHTLEELMQYVEENNLAVNETLFAAYTAAAFEWYSKLNPDYLILETGLGGRFDPTNVIEDKIAVLTSISYDHMQYLGEDIKDIAAEKCGIIKEGNIVISASQIDEVKAIIKKTCNEKNAELTFVSAPLLQSSSVYGQSFLYKGKQYSINSIGKTQPENAALAIECAEKLGLSDDAVRKGLLDAKTKARIQFKDGNPPMIIDGAHNPSAIKMLVDTLKVYFNGKKKVLLFACMQDKDYNKMIDILSKEFIYAVLVSADIQRGADVHELKKLFSKHMPAKVELDIPSGAALAKKIAEKEEALLVVCGSFYLAGSEYVHNLT